MKKEIIIKKSEDINRIINNGKKYNNGYYYIYKDKNDLNKYRFCICVSKKIGNAVTRNKNKRQIKDIIDKSKIMFSNNTDYVIILGRDINKIDFNKKKEYLINLLNKVEGDKHEK